jgi:hypothetical protein
MENLLKKMNLGMMAQFHVIQSFEQPSQPTHANMQLILEKHEKIIFEPPRGLPPSQGEHGHSIPLILGRIPPMYAHITIHFPKNEIENIV